MIKPINTCLLLELKGEYQNIPHQDERFNTTKSRGIVVAIAKMTEHEAIDTPKHCEELGIKVGSTVYFNAYEDNCSFKRDGKEYALIELKIIKGVEYGS
jgi:co-chaperonin GroES (HSP10)